MLKANGVKAIRRKLSDYVLDSANPRKPTQRGASMLESSIEDFGPARSGVADADGIIRAGNQTAEQLMAAGIEDVIEVETTGKEWVVVRRKDMDAPTGKRYAVADNRTGELGDWNADVLASLQTDGVDLARFFDADELDALLAGVADGGTPPGDAGAAIARAEEWQKRWQVERGQVWSAGRHRIMCGSAYDTGDLARLMDGKKSDMLHTDPPYGIGIVKPLAGESAAAIGGAKPFGATGETKRHGPKGVAFRDASRGHVRRGAPSRNQISKSHNEYLTIRGDVGRVSPGNIIQSNLYPVIQGDDTPFDPTLFLDFAPVVVMWGANYYADLLPVSSCWICWDKREDITRNNFADGELAWTNQDKPMRIFHHLWNGLHKGSQWGEARMHPTEKPVALFEEIGKMYAPGGLWVDLFAGSGPQLVAAENTGATCFAMEVEVLYVATILQRLADMGLVPVRAEAV